jgi:hypothetical protein
MCKWILTMMAVVLLVGAVQASATVYNLNAAKDAHINLDNTTETGGTGTTVSIQNNATTDYINWLGFDLSSIAASEVVVTSAVLTINQRCDHTVNTYIVLKQGSTDVWAEATITAGNEPARGPIIGNVYMDNSGGTAATWVQNSIDVTSFVQASVGAGKDYTVSFVYDLPGYSTNGTGSPYYRAIAGAHEGTSSPWATGKAGVLSVTAIVPEPVTLSLLGVGGLLALLRRRR